MEYVEEKSRKNFIIYADNRTGFYKYDYEKQKMLEDKTYKIGKGFNRDTDMEEIKFKITNLFNRMKSNQSLKELHPNKIIPKFKIFEKDVQIRIQIELPDNYEFGDCIVKELEKELKDYGIEAHAGRTGFYITKEGLDKSMAVQHAINYFNLDREGIISIGDKFGIKADSDLHIVMNCGILGINVGKEIKTLNISLDKPLIQIGNGINGTFEVLSYILNQNFYKYESVKTRIKEESFLQNILEKSENRGVIIGIEGPTGCGKTSYAYKLKNKIEQFNKDVHVIQMDWFVKERKERQNIVDNYLYGEMDLNCYTNMAWECEELFKTIEIIKKLLDYKQIHQSQKICLKNVYDRLTGLKNKDIILDINSKSIILIEGIDFINRNSKKFMDVCVKMDVFNNDVLINRILKREKIKQSRNKVSNSMLHNRFYCLDVCHAVYVQKKDINLYDYYIDNTDYLSRKISYIKEINIDLKLISSKKVLNKVI